MKKTLLASLFTMALVSQAEAGCLTLTNRYSGTIPPESTVTVYGPVTLVNGPGCRSITIAARVNPWGVAQHRKCGLKSRKMGNGKKWLKRQAPMPQWPQRLGLSGFGISTYTQCSEPTPVA